MQLMTRMMRIQQFIIFTVEQVMAKKLVSIAPDATIKEAAEILATKEFHALPVCEGELRWMG